MEEREWVVEFWLREKMLSLRKNLTTKTVDFCVKMFQMMRGVDIKFFLIENTSKIIYIYEFGKIFGFELISCFRMFFFFHFLEIMN
jgi:hypothetical protein